MYYFSEKTRIYTLNNAFPINIAIHIGVEHTQHVINGVGRTRTVSLATWANTCAIGSKIGSNFRGTGTTRSRWTPPLPPLCWFALVPIKRKKRGASPRSDIHCGHWYIAVPDRHYHTPGAASLFHCSAAVPPTTTLTHTGHWLIFGVNRARTITRAFDSPDASAQASAR